MTRKVKISTLTFLCILLSPAMGTFRMYQKDLNKRFLNPFDTVGAITEMDCCRRCYIMAGCEIASYNSADRVCEMGTFHSNDDSYVVSTTGWNMIYDAADDCASNPCTNAGVCMDDIGHYTCRCASGWKGTNCETESRCPADWEEYENSCYYIRHQEYTWDGAMTACGNNGSHLVDITSDLENSFISSCLTMEGIDDGYIWIGGRINANDFCWTDGSLVRDNVQYWDADTFQPTRSAGEDCMAIVPTDGFYTWHDSMCSHNCISMCEFEMA